MGLQGSTINYSTFSCILDIKLEALVHKDNGCEGFTSSAIGIRMRLGYGTIGVMMRLRCGIIGVMPL